MSGGYRPALTDVYDTGGLGGNRDYYPLLDVTWDEARQAVDEEVRLLAAHHGDLAAALAEHEANVEDGGEGDQVLADLDIGVAGATFALSAADVLTISSCNGAPGHHETSPVIALVTDDARLDLLTEFASQTGLVMNQVEGLTVLSAPLVDAFGELAARVLEAAGKFELCDRPREAPDSDEHSSEEAGLYPSWD